MSKVKRRVKPMVNLRTSKQLSTAELNSMRLNVDLASFQPPELVHFYVNYAERKVQGGHDADWSARFPNHQSSSIEIVADQGGAVVSSALFYEDKEYNLIIPKTSSNGKMEIYMTGISNVFLFLDRFFKS